MLDQPLTSRQTIAIILMFTFGSSAVVGVSSSVAQDAWISLCLSLLGAIPILMIYARIIKLNPAKDIFQIFECTMGKVFGKIATALITWYSIHLCAILMRNFSEFMAVTSLNETPQIPILAIMFITVALLAKGGGKALGKWAIIIAPIVIGILLITVIFSFNTYNYSFILPVFEHNTREIVTAAFQVFSFPFAETVILLGIADMFTTHRNIYKVFATGKLLGALLLMIVTLRNLFVLGPIVMADSYFPSYMAVRIIQISDFLTRIEGSISANFILAGITKTTLCLIVASRGLTNLFGFSDWRSIVYPTGFVALALSVILYGNIMQMFAFISYYPYYALPFQVILPLLSWILSELRARRNNLIKQAKA